MSDVTRILSQIESGDPAAAEIAELTRGWDGIWRGRWTKFECMPIDLAPLREPQGPDAPQARTRGDGMYWLVDDQIPESGIGFRNHEDWMWQHFPTVELVLYEVCRSSEFLGFRWIHQRHSADGAGFTGYNRDAFGPLGCQS